MLFRNTPKYFLFFPILYALIGCKNVDNSKFRNYFFYNEDANITTLDPAYVKSQSDNWAVSQLFEGLVEYNDSLEIKPCIAKHWSVFDNGTRYIFNLRTDVYFHETNFRPLKNRRLIADDVVYSFKRIANPKTASPGAWIFNDKMDLRCFGSDSFAFPVKALNDSTVEIKLNAAFAPFLGILAMPYCYIVPKEAAEDADYFRNHPIGSGPFQFKKWEEDVALLFEKNPKYYRFENGVRLPYLSGVYIDNIKNKQTAFMRFIQGEYDFFNGIDASIKDELLNKNGTLKTKYESKLKLLKTPFLNTEYFGFNIDTSFNNSPLNNLKVRQAMQYAIDKKKMIAYIRNGVGVAAEHGFVPNGLPNYPYDKVKGYAYDIEKARQLIKESKIDFTKATPIVLNITSDYLDMAVFVQKELELVGIPIKIEVHPSSFLRQLKKENKINFFRGSWIADYPDAENYMVCFKQENFSPAGPNYFHFYNAEANDAIIKSNLMSSDSARNDMLARADQLMVESAVCIVLYYDESLRMSHPWVKGLTSNPANFLRLRSVKKVY